MNVGLIDADLLDKGTNFPNLALMKLSKYWKSKGAEIQLLEDYNNLSSYDSIFLTKVFDFTSIPDNVIQRKNVHIGGTGFYFDKAPDLPPEIEHIHPDYSLYEHIIKDFKPNKKKEYELFSIGFTTRGCFRKCPFCVNRKYDKVIKHSPIEEFLEESKPYISLLDDNFLGFTEWQSILSQLRLIGKPV